MGWFFQRFSNQQREALQTTLPPPHLKPLSAKKFFRTFWELSIEIRLIVSNSSVGYIDDFDKERNDDDDSGLSPCAADTPENAVHR